MGKKEQFIIFSIVMAILMVCGYFDNKKIYKQKLKDADYLIDNKTGDYWQNEIYTPEEKESHHNLISYKKVQTWESAQKYCSSLVIENITDWSLPTIHELERAYSFSTKFKENPGWTHWSSTTVENFPQAAYCVDFNGGKVWQCRKEKTAYVKCIKRNSKYTPVSESPLFLKVEK